MTTHSQSITPEWLTEILHAHGALPQGRVVAIEQRGNNAFNSAAAHLSVTYSEDAPETAPQRLFLKRNIEAEWGKRAGAREVSFYKLVAPLAEQLPMIIHCYAAEFDEANGTSYILLQDVSETHTPPVTRAQLIAYEGVPEKVQLEQVVDTIAQFHAFWWQHPLLNKDITGMVQYYSDQQQTQKFWNSFIADEGTWFPANLQAMFEEALASLPQLWECFLASRVPTFTNMTMGHSDCYLSQFLCPNTPALGQTYLIDFQGSNTDFGAYDLVHLFAAFWTREQRQENNREVQMLHRYHEGLQLHGITGYSWDDLLTDYKVLLTYMLFYPVWDQTDGASKDYWWPKMQCLIDAYQDWECAALWRA
ncbi:MAG TPA: oxidoreductase family protein [Ktedonobacteraceae bacterium]|nr:oxidoreductase family protein [Ktedonobacteraceae bacterium]